MENKVEVNGETFYKKIVLDEVWEIGESYHIETVTKYFTGVLVAVTDTDLVITKASYIASTGYFSDYIKGGNPNDCEPFDPDQMVNINRGSYVSAVKRNVLLELIR